MKNIALHIMDIAQNSITAKSSEISVRIDQNSPEETRITIIDNGTGISKEKLKTITDPYTTSRTTRKVGLGLPLFKQNAERTEGSFGISSELGKGTVVTACFKTKHFDCLPLGDIPGVMSLLIGANPKLDFIYEYKKNKQTYILNTKEVKEVLDGIPLNEPEVQKMIKEMIASNMQELNESK